MSARPGTAGASASAPAVQQLADRFVAQVPSLLGLSVSPSRSGLTSTSAATDDRAAALDGVQYLGGGPCVEAAVGGAQVRMDDALGESRWEEYALAAASLGVRSSLSLPFVDGTVRGAVNLYGADSDAFTGQHEELQALVDGLDMTGAEVRQPSVSQTTPSSLLERDVVETAVAYLAASRRHRLDEGRALLHHAAERAGVGVPVLAKALLHLEWDTDPRPWSVADLGVGDRQ